MDAKGTVVEAYLNSRGIYCQIPPSLRFHPALKHHNSGQVMPAMVAAVTTWPGDKVAGIQRTWLRRDGLGKAELIPNKMSLGPIARGAVQLAECGSVLGVAMWVETALSVQQELGIPMWLALGSGNFGKVILPPPPLASEVRLYVDGDAGGRDAVAEVAPRLHDEGRKVVPCHAPEGFDFNDLLLEKRAES